jgi:nicotinamide-nucleotide amidase
LFKTDISLSTTGVAGPNSDEFESEIGTVLFIRLKILKKPSNCIFLI